MLWQRRFVAPLRGSVMPGRGPGHGAAGMRGIAGLGLFQHSQGETVPAVVGVRRCAGQMAKTSRLLPGRPGIPSRRAPVPFRARQPFSSHQHPERHGTPAASSTSTGIFAIFICHLPSALRHHWTPSAPSSCSLAPPRWLGAQVRGIGRSRSGDLEFSTNRDTLTHTTHTTQRAPHSADSEPRIPGF